MSKYKCRNCGGHFTTNNEDEDKILQDNILRCCYCGSIEFYTEEMIKGNYQLGITHKKGDDSNVTDSRKRKGTKSGKKSVQSKSSVRNIRNKRSKTKVES